jgi:hypothetical protein
MKPLLNFFCHYKELPYRRVGRARHSEDLSSYVVYQALYRAPKDDALWIRPEAMFYESVKRDGIQIPRFRQFSHLSEVPADIIQKIWIPDFTNCDYLRTGSGSQRVAFQLLTGTQLFDALREFDPILAGTYPLDLVVQGSDLDILCQSANVSEVLQSLKAFEAHQSSERTIEIRNLQLPIEIYVEDTPTREQRAYRHLVAEAKLLAMGGPEVRQEIHQLKIRGAKTEPAFAQVFEIEGDPYEGLLLEGIQ